MSEATNSLLNNEQAQKTNASSVAFDGEQHVTFSIDGQLFAASMGEVGDIVDVDMLTPVPKTSGIIRGLINVRGRILTMIDLRALFGQPVLPLAKNEAAVTYEYNGEGYALAVDQVKDIIGINDANLLTNLPNLSKIIRTCSRGIFRSKGNLILVLSLLDTMGLIVKNAENSQSNTWAEIIENKSNF